MSSYYHNGAHLMDLSAVQVAALVNTRKVSPVACVSAALERIEKLNPIINAFSHVARDAALRDAEALERRLREEPELALPLAGVPIGVKDLEDAAGLPTSFGCVLFKGNIAAEDSVQVARLKAAGCIVIGKTNTPIFGSNGFTSNLAFGATRNPWNLKKTPGGSSGGSSAAVAARTVPLATAADGGGSIRIPAANTGLIGFKGTRGRIPQQENAMFRTQPWILCVHVGPVARTWEDTVAYLDATMGYHPLDPYSIPAPSTPYSQLPKPSRLKILYTPSLTPVLDSRIAKQVRAALDVLRGLGHEVVEKELEIPSIAAAWGLLMGSQLAATVRTAIVDKFGEDSLAKLERGVVNSWSFLDKLMTLEQTGNLHRQLFELNSFFANHIFPERGGFDLMITPGLPIPALGVNGKLPKQVEGQELDAEAAYGTMFPFNFLGLPSGVVRTPGRLEEWRETMGSMQIVGPKYEDGRVLALLKEYVGAVPGLLDSWPSLEEISRQAGQLGLLSKPRI